MKTKSVLLAGSIVSLISAVSAHANLQLDGSFGSFNEGGGSYTSSSLTILRDNFVSGSIGGDFVGVLPQYSLVTTYSSPITGLSATPSAISINNFFEIASAGNPFGGSLHGAGTTPANRFDFNLATLSESANGVFNGTGTLVDITGAYSDTPADFTLSFSGQGSYSFTFATAPVPEPAAWGFVAGLFPMGLALRRWKNAFASSR